MRITWAYILRSLNPLTEVLNGVSVYNNKKSRIQQLLLNPKNSNTIYAAVNGTGVIKSVDGGQTWNLTMGLQLPDR